ncbi:P27 family phage terminase small subunit [Enterococcus sp.]|uniref:P27 family phage terminase small subunit n=1 Tax=Enterococcus sp. TaxID=35783 RepID=UPI003C73DC59
MKQADLKKQLMAQVDSNDQLKVEKVERYLDLVRIYRKLNTAISKFGPMIEVENGSQKFLKPNPAISEKIKLSAAITRLGKDLNLQDSEMTLTDMDDEYDESDLT